MSSQETQLMKLWLDAEEAGDEMAAYMWHRLLAAQQMDDAFGDGGK